MVKTSKQTKLTDFEKLYVCKWCGKVYTNPSSLSLHRSRCPNKPIEYDVDNMKKIMSELEVEFERFRNISELDITNKALLREIRKALKQYDYVLRKLLQYGCISNEEFIDKLNISNEVVERLYRSALSYLNKEKELSYIT